MSELTGRDKLALAVVEATKEIIRELSVSEKDIESIEMLMAEMKLNHKPFQVQIKFESNRDNWIKRGDIKKSYAKSNF